MTLQRSTSDRMIAGVCGGIAEEYNIDATLVRLITAAIVLFTGVGPALYILGWILMPQANGHIIAQDAVNRASDWTKSRKDKRGGQPYPDPHAGRQYIHNADDLR